MEPIFGQRALLLDRTLVIADLHIGVENELAQRGVKVPRQLPVMEGRVRALLEDTGAKRLVVLGDLKHTIPDISIEEYRAIPPFIKRLQDLAEVVLVKGNHDGDIEKIVPDLPVVKSIEVGAALMAHGHMRIEDLDYESIILAHNHPAVAFRDENGVITRESAWVRGRLKEEVMKGLGTKEVPRIILMPAFNDILAETPVNDSERLLGPIFRQGLVDVEGAEVYLLDGTDLGRIEDLRFR